MGRVTSNVHRVAGARRPAAGARAREGGLTLIELLVAVALLGLVAGSAVRGVQALAKSELRSAAGKVAGAMRYLFDRASTTGRVHRLVLDLDGGKYWAEASDDRFYLPRDRETEESRRAEFERIAREQELRQERLARGLPAEEPREEDEGSGRGRGLGVGFGATRGPVTVERYLPKPYEPKPPRFQPVRERTVRPVELKKARLAGLFTPRQSDAIGSGLGYVYFFPLGFAEAAIVYLSDEKGEAMFSLVMHPLTGRVKVVGGYVEPPIEQLYDDEGNLLSP